MKKEDSETAKTELRKLKSENEIGDQLYFAILKSPLLLQFMLNEAQKRVVGEKEAIITMFICASGRLVKNANPASYNLLINSESGAGKDWVTTKTLEVIPSRDWIKRTRISPTAFTYWKNKKFDPEWTWDGKIFYGEDLSNSVINSDVFKVMCSSGSCATIVIKQRAVDIEVVGKPVIFVTTAQGIPTIELMRRFNILNLTESDKQTSAIINHQAKKLMNADKLFSAEEEKIDSSLVMAQTRLMPVKVSIPFAEKVAKLFPVDSIMIRTLFPRFLDYIKASCALHQYSRKRNENNYLIAEPVDYENAVLAFKTLLFKNSLLPLTRDQKEIVDLLSNGDNRRYTVAEIAVEIPRMVEKRVRRNLDKLGELNLLLVNKRPTDKGREPLEYGIRDAYMMTYFPPYDEIDEHLRRRAVLHNIGDEQTDEKSGLLDIIPINSFSKRISIDKNGQKIDANHGMCGDMEIMSNKEIMSKNKEKVRKEVYDNHNSNTPLKSGKIQMEFNKLYKNSENKLVSTKELFSKFKPENYEQINKWIMDRFKFATLYSPKKGYITFCANIDEEDIEVTEEDICL